MSNEEDKGISAVLLASKEALSALANLGEAADKYREDADISQAAANDAFDKVGLEVSVMNLARDLAKARKRAKFFQ